jgi:hypothetical protein
MRTVNEIQQGINALIAEKETLINGIKSKNDSLLIEEILNLRDGVGKGFTEGDYYAPSRYYSKIKGVKNLREIEYKDECYVIEVKVHSPVGYMLNESIKIEGITYHLSFVESKHFTETLDY